VYSAHYFTGFFHYLFRATPLFKGDRFEAGLEQALTLLTKEEK